MTNATLNRKVFLALALGAALAVQADAAVYDETTGFVTCVTKDPAGAVMDATTWSDATDFPNSQTNYYVGAGFVAKTGGYESNKATFSPSLYVAGQITSSGTGSDSMTFEDLHLLPGAVMYNHSIPTWKGDLTIETPEGTDPVTFSHNREGSGYPFKMSMNVSGDEHARIVMTGTKTCYMSRNGSWSGFYGTFNVRNSYTISDGASASATPGTLAFGTGCTYNQNSKTATSFGNLTFGDKANVNGGILTVSGKFEVGADSLVTLSNGSSFASFSLGSGSTLQFIGADSAISVASKLELGEDVTVNYVTSKASVLRDDPFFPVFYLAPACVEAGLPALDGINIAVSGAPEWLPADFQACYRDNPDVEGGKILGLFLTTKIVRSLHSNPQTEAEAKNHETLHLFLDSEEPTEYWSDGSYPHEGCVYYSSASIAVCNKCVLPELVVHDGSTFYVVGTCSLNELRMAAGNMYVRYDSASVTGRIGIYASSIYFRTYQGRTLRLNADIYGEGNMDFRVYYPSGTSVSKFYLSGDNSGWSGGLYFSKADESGKTYVLSEQNHVKLYVNNSASLGGGTTEFAYNKIQLNDYAEILVTDNVDFTNACRGVYVKANGAISVDAGRTARFAAPVTMDGTLRKNGAGTLVLGGPMRFLSGKASVEDPVGDGNLVAVTAGSLAVADCNALNGAKLSFAEGTALVVSADATGDLKTNGARFDKIAAPFATDVPVRIETADPAKLTENSYSVGLVTVKAADAESVKLSVTSGIRGFRVTSVTSAPGAVADTVTFTATLEKQGLMLLVR